MNKYLPKEIEKLIWEYKHSAEMYDVTLQFKKWFYANDSYYDGNFLNGMNLYNYPAFNYRTRLYKTDLIFNIFQARGNKPVGLYGIKIFGLDECKEFGLETIPQFDENRKIDWRQEYIDQFNL